MLDTETLKKRLKYQGNQYSQGQEARGGVSGSHMLTQAANRIEALEQALNDLLNDCINFDGGKLTDLILKQASETLKGNGLKFN